MTLSAIGLFFIPVAIGALIVHLLWPGTNPKSLLVKASLGVGVGFGLTSLLYFLFLLCFAGRSGFLVIPLGLLAVLTVVSARRTSLRKISLPKIQLTWLQTVLLSILGTVTLLAVLTVVNITLERPHGGFDAWLIWNRASRFIFRGTEYWKTTFSRDFFFFFHADYPLLIPLTNAWVWDALKIESLRVPFLQAAIYLFGSALLLFSALQLTRSFGQACIATIILFGTSAYTTVGSAQMADIPLAMLILAVVIVFHLYLTSKAYGLLILAGFFVGLCGWAKNEGQIFIVFSSFAFGFIFAQDKNQRRQILWYLIGLSLPLTTILYFKLTLAPPNDLAEGNLQSAIQRITDLSRYLIIGKAIINELKGFAGWAYSIPLFVLYYFFMRDENGLHRRWRLASTIILTLQIISYIAVYIVTPRPLEFHLAHSFDRILLHTYPAFLFVLFASTLTPETVFSSPKNKSTGLQSGT